MALFVAGQKIRASQLNVGLGTYSLYTGTNTALGANTWTPIPFTTLVTGLGSGLTPSAGNTTFTLAAGCWSVQFSACVDQASHTGVTGCFFALVNNSAVPASSSYAEMNAPVSSGQVTGTITAVITSDGTYEVIPVIYCAGAASAIILTNSLGPRLTFKQVND
jgi:hypothetical protein